MNFIITHRFVFSHFEILYIFFHRSRVLFARDLGYVKVRRINMHE